MRTGYVAPPSKERERGFFLAADPKAVTYELAIQRHFRAFLASTSTHVRDIRGGCEYTAQIVDKEEMRRRIFDPMPLPMLSLPPPPPPKRRGKKDLPPAPAPVIHQGSIALASQLDREIWLRGGGELPNHRGGGRRNASPMRILDTFRDQGAMLDKTMRRHPCRGFLTAVARRRLTHLLEDQPQANVLMKLLDDVDRRLTMAELRLASLRARPLVNALAAALLATPPVLPLVKGKGVRRNINRLRRERARVMARIFALHGADTSRIEAA